MSVDTLAREGRIQFAARERARPLSGAAAPVIAVTVLAAVLRFTRIGHQGFWFDEANTALLVHFSPGQMIGLIPQTESTPPLYYCVAWVWARIFGYGETGLRSLSALAGVALVPVMIGAGAKLISRRAGLIAAALTACNPLLIWYSQEARSYELVALLSGLSLLGFAYAKSDPTPRLLLAWAVASALALATHYYAVLIVVPEAVWLLAVHRRRRAVRLTIAAVGVCGLALIPLAISQNATGHANWIAKVGLGRRLAEVVPQFLVGFVSVAHDQLVAASIGLCLVALGLLAAVADRELRGRALAVGGMATAGLFFGLLLVAVGVDVLLTRNLISLWIPAALLVAGGLSVTRAAWAGVAVTAALCAIGTAAAASVATSRDLQRPDWRGVAQVLGTEPAPGPHGRFAGRAILIQHYRYLLPLSLYVPGLRPLRRGAVEPVNELDVVTFTDPASAGFCWWGSACNLWPSKPQRAYAVKGFHESSRRTVYQFTVVRLVPDHPLLLTRRAVGAALRKTRLRDDELLIQRP